MLPLTPTGLLRSALAMGGDREAVVDGALRFTYEALERAVQQAAELLAAAGIGAGDRVAHLGRSSASHAILLFATARLGAMYVALDPWMRPAMLNTLIEKAAPKAIVLGHTLRGRPFTNDLTSSSWRLPDSLLCIDAARGAWAQAMSPAGPPVPQHALTDDSGPRTPHLILFTSGTTGEPRGVVYDQEAFAGQALVINLGLASSPTDRFLNVYPPGHFGSLMPVLQTVAAGACLVQSAVPAPEKVSEAIRSERITVLVAVPSLWRRVLEQPTSTREMLSSLRLANIASDSISTRLIEQVMDRTGALSIQGYGLTEAGLVTLLPTADARRRIGSAGLALPFAAVQIRCRDGALAQPMEEGEVWVKTEYGMAGLWDGHRVIAPERGQDGFFRTGDLGWLDAEHYLTIGGREEDLLKISGYRISASAIEDVLRDHPACADAAVIGLPSEKGGQSVVAIVVPRQAHALRATELMSWVGQALQPQAVPARFAVAGEIPRTDGTGKIRRKNLIDRFLGGEFPPLAG